MEITVDKGYLNFVEFSRCAFLRSGKTYISTFNIVLGDEIERILNNCNEVHLVVNPSPLKDSCEKDIQILRRLVSRDNIKLYFNRNNHSKILISNNIAYIGSANFSEASKNNIEAGIIIKDENCVSNLKSDFKNKILQTSSPFNSVASHYKDFSLNIEKNSLISKYKSLLNNVEKCISYKTKGWHPDPGGESLKKLVSIIEEITDLNKGIYSTRTFIELNIAPSLNLELCINELKRVKLKVEKFRQDGTTLIRAAESRELDQSIMTLDDYEREFGDFDIMDSFVSNRGAYRDLERSLNNVYGLLSEELSSIIRYLGSLMWFGERARKLDL